MNLLVSTNLSFRELNVINRHKTPLGVRNLLHKDLLSITDIDICAEMKNSLLVNLMDNNWAFTLSSQRLFQYCYSLRNAGCIMKPRRTLDMRIELAQCSMWNQDKEEACNSTSLIARTIHINTAMNIAPYLHNAGQSLFATACSKKTHKILDGKKHTLSSSFSIETVHVCMWHPLTQIACT